MGTQSSSSRCWQQCLAWSRAWICCPHPACSRNYSSYSLCMDHTTDTPINVFVVFFQRRQRSQVSLEKHIDGKVLTWHGTRFCSRLELELELDGDCESCFLYWVPGKSNRMKVRDLQVDLKVTFNFHHSHLWYWMELLVGPYCACHRIKNGLFPVVLLRAAAMILLESNGQKFKTLKEDLELEGFVTTPEGLQSIVAVCDVMLRDWPAGWYAYFWYHGASWPEDCNPDDWRTHFLFSLKFGWHVGGSLRCTTFVQNISQGM